MTLAKGKTGSTAHIFKKASHPKTHDSYILNTNVFLLTEPTAVISRRVISGPDVMLGRETGLTAHESPATPLLHTASGAQLLSSGGASGGLRGLLQLGQDGAHAQGPR